MWPFTSKPKLHPLLTAVLELNADAWNIHASGHDEDDKKWIFISRTCDDKLYLKSTGILSLANQFDEKWYYDPIDLTSTEQALMKKTYDEIIRKKAHKIVEYRTVAAPHQTSIGIGMRDRSESCRKVHLVSGLELG